MPRQTLGVERRRLNELASAATLELKLVPCSCPPGTEGTDRCNYDRSCGSLLADGRDVGEVLYQWDWQYRSSTTP